MNEDLPPLPKPAQEAEASGYMPLCPIEIPATPDYFTAEQMQAYARAAIHSAPQPAVQQEPAGEPVRYEYRWTNPAGDPNPDSISMDWCAVEPRWNGTVQEKCAELLAHRYAGKPCYEVRALYTRPAVPLSDEQITKLHMSIPWGVNGVAFGVALTRAVEAAHKIGGTE